MAIAFVESDFDNTVISNKGAMGLFQIIPKYTLNPREARRKIKENDIKYQRQLAYTNLAYWFKVTKGDKRLALAGFNAGYKYKVGVGLEYADKVIALEKEFRELKNKGIV